LPHLAKKGFLPQIATDYRNDDNGIFATDFTDGHGSPNSDDGISVTDYTYEGERGQSPL
jgi:hypothetical protein